MRLDFSVTSSFLPKTAVENKANGELPPAETHMTTLISPQPQPHLASAVLYGDVTCPACYLASLRTDLLVTAGLEPPQWRLVEHRPAVRLTASAPDDATQQARERELEAVLAHVQEAEGLDPALLPRRVPTILPSTSAAVTAYAEALNAGVGDAVRRLLFAAYWRDGLDLSNVNLLRSLLMQPVRHAIANHRLAAPAPSWRWDGAANVVPWTGNVVSVHGGPITSAGERLARTWRDERRAVEAPACLTLVLPTKRVLSGAAALDELLLPGLVPASRAAAPAADELPLAAAG
jgi:hypothetical protein